MGRMSNRERIQRAAEEARLAADEKSAKAAAKPASRAKRTKAPERVKIVWNVCTGGGEVLETFPYSEKAAAEALLAKLSRSGRTVVLKPNKVPLE